MTDSSTYTTTIDIKAPPATVYRYLVTGEGFLAWLGQHAEVDASPGGRFALDIDGTPVRGHYLEVDPPHRVVLSWGVAGSTDLPPGRSRVEFTLTPIDSGTRLDVTHTGLPPTRAPGHARGWPRYLARLQVVITSRPGR